MTILAHIADRAINRPLLIHPDKVPLILGVLEGRIPIDVRSLTAAAPVDPSVEMSPDAQAILRRGPQASRFVGSEIDEDDQGRHSWLPYRRTDEGVAVVTITGTLINRGAWIGSKSGETSYEGIKHQIARAVADPKARSIILDIESPGGEAVGTFEVADAVRKARSAKPVVAVANGMAASAAYAIASGASRIVATPTSLVGSIGVVLLHADFSRRFDKAGITPTLIFAGAHKVDGNPFEPLSSEVRDDLQNEVNEFYDLFVETVSTGRKAMSAQAIRATEARTFIGRAAVDEGLADEIGTFEDVLSELSRGQGGRSTSSTRRTSMSEQTNGGPAAESPAGTTTVTSAAAPVAPTAAPAAADAKGRIKAILALEEAKGREAQAQVIALDTDMSVEQAKALLAASPKAGAADGNLAAADPAATYAAERTGALAQPGAKPPGSTKATAERWAAAKRRAGVVKR